MSKAPIVAKFAGKCFKCGRSFAAGTAIYYTGYKQTWHVACFKGQATSEAQAQAQSWRSEETPQTQYSPAEVLETPRHCTWTQRTEKPQYQRRQGIYRYDSAMDMLNDYQSVCRWGCHGALSYTERATDSGRGEWAGQHGRPSEVLSAVKNGDTSHLAQVMTILEEISPITFDSLVTTVQPSTWGSRVSIGDYLTGSPSMFRRRVRHADESAPVRVFFDVTSAAACDSKTIAVRSALVLAAIERIQATRACELHLVCAVASAYHNACYITVRIPSNPVSVSEASYSICESSLMRVVMFDLAYHYENFSGGWPRDTGITTHRAALGLNPDDIWIEALTWTCDLSTPEARTEWLRSHFGSLLFGDSNVDHVAESLGME